MRFALVWVSMVLSIAGCRSGIDCGTYVLDEARQVCVCPPGTVELPEGGCVAGDAGPTDAGVDAASSGDVGPVDMGMNDGGSSCVAETCNGADDDCDGLIDEGVLTVGPAVTVTTGGGLHGGLMVPLADGFGILAHSRAVPSVFTWFRIGPDGVPMGTGLPLGTDTDQPGPFFFDATAGDGTVFTAFLGDTAAAADPSRMIGFDPVSGGRTTGAPFVVPSSAGREGAALVRVASVRSGRVTVYFSEHMGTEFFVRRLRLAVSGGALTVVSSVDVGPGTLANALSTEPADYVFANEDGAVTLFVGPSEDAVGSFRELGPVPFAGALAIADPSQPVSATNPLGVASAGYQPEPASFFEITNTTVLGMGAAIPFADSVGTYRDIAQPHVVDLIALPTADASVTHWVIATLDNQGASVPATVAAVLQVHEVARAGATVRGIVVPDEVAGQRADIRLARFGDSIRIVEGTSAEGIVTRAVGCE